MLTMIVRIIRIKISSKFNEFTGFMPKGAKWGWFSPARTVPVGTQLRYSQVDTDVRSE